MLSISFEQDVVRPAFANSHVFFKERPITAVRADKASMQRTDWYPDARRHIFFSQFFARTRFHVSYVVVWFWAFEHICISSHTAACRFSRLPLSSLLPF
jgi:hypothetical protein